MKCQDKTKKTANEEMQDLFIEYTDVLNAQVVIVYNEIYRCAFKDAVKIYGIIERMKKE